MLAFAVAIFFLMITPGPGVLSLAGVGSAFGPRAGWSYGVGLFFGSNAVMIAAALGLAALLQTNDASRFVFIGLSTGYLLYLAARIALTGSKIAFIEAIRPPGIAGGVTLQAFNPKAYAVGAFVFSNFPMTPGNHAAEIAIKLVILNLIWVPIHIGWMYAGVGLHALNLAPASQRAINIAMAVAMLIVVALALRSSLFG